MTCVEILHGLVFSVYFFFNDTATTEIYTLSLHDALPIYITTSGGPGDATSVPAFQVYARAFESGQVGSAAADRKSTRLNSSHANISYAVFCLKKKKNITETHVTQS